MNSGQDWESASGVARAFQIGKAESSALFALVKEVPERIRESLEAMVKARGMTKLFTHKIIGKGTFSVGFSSGTSTCESWAEPLTNLKDDFSLATWLAGLKVC